LVFKNVALFLQEVEAESPTKRLKATPLEDEVKMASADICNNDENYIDNTTNESSEKTVEVTADVIAENLADEIDTSESNDNNDISMLDSIKEASLMNRTEDSLLLEDESLSQQTQEYIKKDEKEEEELVLLLESSLDEIDRNDDEIVPVELAEEEKKADDVVERNEISADVAASSQLEAEVHLPQTSSVNGSKTVTAEKVEVSMEAVLKTLNKHLKRAVNRLKDDDSKVATLKKHLGDIIEEVMIYSKDSERLEKAVEHCIQRFEITGTFESPAGSGVSGSLMANLTTMQLDSELSLDELVNYLTEEIENEYRKTKTYVSHILAVTPKEAANYKPTAKEVNLPSSSIVSQVVSSEEKGAAEIVSISEEMIEESDEARPVSMDKSKLFSEMEDKFAKDTQSALKNKPVYSRKNKSESESSDAKIILMKEPGEVELKENLTPEVISIRANDHEITSEDPSMMLMSPGARSDGAMDKEIESENESVSPISVTQSSELIKSLRKVRVKRSRNSSSNNPEMETSIMNEVENPSPPRLIRPRLLMSPPATMPDITSSHNQTSPLLFSSLQIEIPDNYRRGPITSNRLTPRMSPAANAKRIEVSPTVLSKIDAETAAGAVQLTPSSSVGVLISVPQLPPQVVTSSTVASSVVRQNGEQQPLTPVPLQQPQQPQQPQHQPLASLKTVIRVPKTITSSTPTSSTAIMTNISSNSFSSLPTNSNQEFASTSSKKKSKRKNLSFIPESDGGVDTAEEEEYQEQYQRKKRNRNLLISDTEYDGKSADESNTDGGGKQSPDSAGVGSSSKSIADEKLAE
jgi:hypothetical protein